MIIGIILWYLVFNRFLTFDPVKFVRKLHNFSHDKNVKTINWDEYIMGESDL